MIMFLYGWLRLEFTLWVVVHVAVAIVYMMIGEAEDGRVH